MGGWTWGGCLICGRGNTGVQWKWGFDVVADGKGNRVNHFHPVSSILLLYSDLNSITERFLCLEYYTYIV